jgi:SAM-dependent methyltransferase
MGVDLARKASYGWYGLPVISVLLAILFVIGIPVLLYVWKPAGWVITGFGLYLLVSYGASMMAVRRESGRSIPDILKVEGNERVLDVGCGLGRMSIEVAKRLQQGKVVGVDIWDKKELRGNSPERAYANAQIEGVRDKVEFRYGNVLELPFQDGTFDLVTCSSVLNNLHGDGSKIKALSEIHRVLKPDGGFFMLEPLRNLRMFFLFTPFAFWELRNRDDWVGLLNRAKFTDLKYSLQDGVGFFAAKKG